MRPHLARPVLLTLLALALVATACGRGDLEVGSPERPVCAAGQIDGDLRIFNRPGYIDPEAIAGFERLNGIEVTQDFFATNESMLSQIEARAAPYDLIIPAEFMVDIMRRDGLLLPLDHIALPGRINLDPLFESPPYDPQSQYSVPYLWGTFGIGVNTNVVSSDVVASWGLIFDQTQASHFAGRISLLDEPRHAMAAALIYLGYSPNSIRKEEISAAADLIADAGINLAGFSNEGYATDLTDGALDVAHGRSDAFYSAFDATSSDYRYLIPEEGTIAWVDNFAIPVTAEHPCTAHAFIDWMLEPRNAAGLANYTSYASPNLAAREHIDEELLANPAIYPPADLTEGFEFLVDVGTVDLLYVDEFFRAQG